jgi:4-aminobutyrate--pyruvate transaminase
MLSNLATRDVETLIHPYTQLASFRETGPLVLERGEGVWVYDTEGKGYIEGMAGLWCTSLGYSNPEIADAAREQMLKLPFTHLFSGRSHDPAIELAEKLKEIAPMPVSKIFFCSSGSEANDTQVKLVWYMNNALGRPQKKKIISRIRGYHGVTVASASLTGLPANHIDFDLPIANILHTSCPHYYRFGQEGESEEDFATRMAQELEEQILREGPDTVAAFIAEPVMGAGGAILPPNTYFREDPGGAGQIRHPLHRGRGHHRLRAPRHALRLAAPRHPPRHPLLREGRDLGLSAARRRDDPGGMYQAMLDESRKVGTFGHGFTYSGHPGLVRGGPEGAGDLRARAHLRGVKAEGARVRGPARGARRPPARRRGAGPRPHRRSRDRRRQAHEGQYDAKKGRRAQMRRLRPSEGLIVRNLMGDRLAICPPLVITERKSTSCSTA